MTKSYSWWNTRSAESVDQKNGCASHQTLEETGIVGDTDQKQHQKTENEKKKEEIVESGKVNLSMKEEKDLTNSSNMVDSPPHYTKSSIECIEAIESATGEGYESYLQGAIIKYIWRYNYKGKPVEDLKKAQWYLDKLIKIKNK